MRGQSKPAQSTCFQSSKPAAGVIPNLHALVVLRSDLRSPRIRIQRTRHTRSARRRNLRCRRAINIIHLILIRRGHINAIIQPAKICTRPRAGDLRDTMPEPVQSLPAAPATAVLHRSWENWIDRIVDRTAAVISVRR